MFQVIIYVAVFLAIILLSIRLLYLFHPVLSRLDHIRAIFRDYDRHSRENRTPEEEAAVWEAVARRAFRRFRLSPEAMERHLATVRDACTDLMERHDIIAGRKEKAKELARRIMICRALGTQERIPVRETERIYQLVEVASQGYFTAGKN